MNSSEPAVKKSARKNKTVTIETAPSGHGAGGLVAADHIKKYFIVVMVGGLIISSIIAIVAVFVGNFNDVIGKALSTTIWTVIHTLLALTVISATVRRRTAATDIIVNTLFVAVIISLMATIFYIWDIISGLAFADVYLVLFYAILSALFCIVILMTDRSVKLIRSVADSTLYVIVFFFILTIPSAFSNVLEPLPTIYFKGLGASAIVLGTMAVLTLIFQKLYAAKKPIPVHTRPIQSAQRSDSELIAPEKKSLPPIVIVLIILGIVFIGLPILGGFFSLLSGLI